MIHGLTARTGTNYIWYLLQLHPDFPNMWDAWDVDEFYRNSVTDLTDAEEVVPGDGASVRVVRAFGSSRMTQVLTLAPGERRLDIDTEVDWHETEKFLKLAFPLDVHAERYASETQFGHFHRPTHTNTSWEAAKFEACNHRFVHVDEPGWGVALVNDSTYGHDVTRDVRASDAGTTTTVRVSLLRAPRFPDPETDQGTHRFRHALAPGATIGDAVREGYRINLPERTLTGGAPVAPLVGVDNDAVVVTAVKLAPTAVGAAQLALAVVTGLCFVFLAVLLVMVVAGLNSWDERVQESTKLMSWGFQAWTAKPLFQTGAKVGLLTTEGSDDAFVVKLDNTTLAPIWVRAATGMMSNRAKDVDIAASGEIVVAGVFQGQMKVGMMDLVAPVE